MKKLSFLMIGFILLTGSAGAVTEKLTAADWTKITRQRKIYFVLGSMEDFQQKKMVFRHTMDEYIGWMDNEAANDASDKDMALIFTDLVSSKELRVPASH